MRRTRRGTAVARETRVGFGPSHWSSMSAGRQDTELAPSAIAGGLVIVLSSRDGACFISEQLQSIRRQTLAEWTLLVRDDGSTDQTLAILDSLAATEPRLRLIRDELGSLGPAKSFGVLLQHALNSRASYTALADQDDVWDSDKLERQLNVLRSREAVVGKAVPLLVHSDLRVVD